MTRIPKILVTLGFAAGIGGLLIAALEGPGSAGQVVFLSGFILAVAGIVWVMLAMPRGSQSVGAHRGLRLAAIGFAIAALPTAVGMLTQTDGVLYGVLFYAGWGLMTIGIVMGIIAIGAKGRGS